ncbi:MAG: hypothetical protein RBU21_09765, partial [FCB group bacterium]|nr:hypothetical protein [FCB group bacterium]
MFSKRKLSTKLAFGFGALVLIIAALGIVAWVGSVQLTQRAELTARGTACVDAMRAAAQKRMQFQIQGLTPNADGKTAADEWLDAFGVMAREMESTLKDPRLDAEAHALLSNASQHLAEYEKN